MREIRFRAWDKENNRMSPFELQDLWAEGHYILQGKSSGYLRGEIMQYTGLHDKNGKEIYEGDIVKFSDNTIHEGVLTKCEYSNRRAQFLYIFLSGENKGKATDMYDDWRKYEVIGNIYENPELVARQA